MEVDFSGKSDKVVGSVLGQGAYLLLGTRGATRLWVVGWVIEFR